MYSLLLYLLQLSLNVADTVISSQKIELVKTLPFTSKHNCTQYSKNMQTLTQQISRIQKIKEPF